MNGVACANCQTPLTGPFCAQCGQRRRDRLRGREIVGTVFDQLFGLESRLGRSIIELTRSPGAVARAYVGGQRARYVNPFKYCLAIIAAYLLLGALLGVDPSQGIAASITQDGEVVPWVEEAQAFVRRNLSNLIFFALPLFALGLRLIYRRSGYNYAETYAFVLFIIGQVFLFRLILTPLAVWAQGPTTLILGHLIHLSFFIWAAMVFYDQRNLVGALRAMASHLLYYLSIIPVAFAFLIFYALFLRP